MLFSLWPSDGERRPLRGPSLAPARGQLDALFQQLDQAPKLLVDLVELERSEFHRIRRPRLRALGLAVTDQRREVDLKERLMSFAHWIDRHVVVLFL